MTGPQPRPGFLRPALLTVLLGVAVVLAVLVLMIEAAVRTEAAIAPARDHGVRLAELAELRGDLARGFGEDPGVAREIAARLQRVAAGGWSEDSARALAEAQALLRDEPRRDAALEQAGATLDRVLLGEIPRHAGLVDAAGGSARWQLGLAMGLSLVALAVLLSSVIYFRRRLLAPLQNLMYLMELMGRQDYTSAMTSRVEPVLRPLFDHYNAMVEGTLAVEARHRSREAGLEREVHGASRALLEQQAALARSERMAAIGEVTARIAHGLRNPITGVQLALENLQRELEQPEAAQRLSAVRNELKRASRLLDELVAYSRPPPEPLVDVRVGASLGELVRLLRYQLPRSVTLELEAPDGLVCRLPEGGLRQIVLSLVLNSAKALEPGSGRIQITTTPREDGMELRVEDDGPGFPAELLASGIADFVTLERGGAGLGLVAVRRLVRGLGGRIELANRAAGGARVTMHLPCGHSHG